MQLLKKTAILICSLTILGGCATGQSAFDKGQRYEITGDFDQAVIKYAEATTANPESGQFRLYFLKASGAAARQHMAKGEKALVTGDYDGALSEYQTAYVLDPSLERARQQGDMIKKLKLSQIILKEADEFEKNRKNREALRSYRKALEFNPANKEASEGIDRMMKAVQKKPGGFELNLKSTKPLTLKFKDAKIKDVFSIISKLSGINFIFDDGVKDTNFSIYMENATFYQVLDVISELMKLKTKVLNETTMIVYPKNTEKSKQYEELFLQTFYLNKIDAKKAINLLRTMMQIKKIFVNEELNAIVIRDTPEVVELAGKILDANDIPDAEVVLEVEVIELTKSNAEQLGFLLSRYAVSTQGFNNGTPFSDTLGATSTTSTTSANPSNLLQLFAFKQFGGFLTVPNATFNFGKTLSNGETLSNPKIRVKNREKAKFNVGTRVPITTTSSPVGGGITTNVQYVDVGVKLNAEPTIQLNNEISIKLGMEVSSILSRDSSSGTSVVTIGTRNLDTVLSLKDGETSIIGGLMQDAKSTSKQKISLLGDIPIIGSLFAENNTNNDKTELILAITPRILRSVTIPEAANMAFWSGKEDEPSTAKQYASFNQEDEAPQAPATTAVSVKGSSEPTPAATVVPQDGRRRRTRETESRQVSVAPAPAFPPVPVPAFPPVPVPPFPPVPTPAVQTQISSSGKGAQTANMVVLDIAAPQTSKVNDLFRVEVQVSNAVNMANALLVMEYDPVLVDFVGAEEGTFLKKDGKATAFTSEAKLNKAKITFGLNRVGDVGGISGSGTLAFITFKAKAKGVVTVRFKEAFFIAAGGGQPAEVNLPSKTIEIK